MIKKKDANNKSEGTLKGVRNTSLKGISFFFKRILGN